MIDPFVIARTADGSDISFIPAMGNRHGLITGATGTGKTVSLQVLADHFSRLGVPVFLADVKGDLSGVAAAGSLTPKLKERLASTGLPSRSGRANPVVFWDVFGRRGFPVRATISDIGPLLLGRLFNLNATQQGVLSLVFKVADDGGLLLLDLKDLRAMLQHVGDNAAEFRTQYGNISAASIGAIQRALLEIEQQGGETFFGEPMLDIDDLLQTDRTGEASSTCWWPTSWSGSRSSTRRSCSGCCRSCSSGCRKSAIRRSRRSSSSSTRRICCSPTRRPRSSKRSSRWCA